MLSIGHNVQVGMMPQSPLPEKITQLQCSSTNAYLQSQFLQWASQSFKYKPQLLAYLQDELQVILGIAEYHLTIRQDKPQPGDFLQNIQFSPISKTTKVMWLLLSVVLPYLIKKVKAYAGRKSTQGWKTVETVLIKVQRAINVLQFFNYAALIVNGRYRSLLQRVLGIRMQFKDPQNKRILNFSLMNRVLVWKVYEFFLKNLLPQVFGFFQGPLKSVFYLSSYMQPEPSSSGSSCIFCSTATMIAPMAAVPCGHRACYYCMRQNHSEQCASCSVMVEQWKPISK